jgi:hypothetical protein
MIFFVFKSFMDQHPLNGNSKITSIKECQIFKFQLIDGTPMLQYKALIWKNKDRKTISFMTPHHLGFISNVGMQYFVEEFSQTVGNQIV